METVERIDADTEEEERALREVEELAPEWRAAAGKEWALRWRIADALAAAPRVRGETYARASEALGGVATSDLRKWVWIAQSVPPAERHPALSWSHHEAVAGATEALRVDLLRRAEAEEWNVARTREEVRSGHYSLPPAEEPKPNRRYRCAGCSHECRGRAAA